MLNNNFTVELDHILQNSSPVETTIKEIRSKVINEIKDNMFLLDCLECVIFSIKNSSSSLWNNPPIYYDSLKQISIRIIFWPSHYSNNPHKHKTWSITGVLFNSILVQTFSWASNIENSTLLNEKTINANKHEVGYLLPDCIHSISNMSDELSATIHISNEAGTRREDNAIWYPSPKKGEILKGARERALIVCLKILSGMKNEKAIRLMCEIYDMSEVKIKLETVKAIMQVDPKTGFRKSRELENDLSKTSQEYHNLVTANNLIEKLDGIR